MDFVTMCCSICAAVCSVTTLVFLIFDRRKNQKLAEVNLSIIPQDKIPDCVHEIFFLKLAFCNESSLPISIMDLKLFFDRYENISTSRFGEGGSLLPESVPVTESIERSDDSAIREHSVNSFSVPITIAPFSSFSGYAAFRAGIQDSFILCNKDVTLKVRTTRKVFDVSMNLMCSNFTDFIYNDKGELSGDAYMG